MHQLQFGTKKNARGIAACENKNKTKQKIIRQEWPLFATPADARSLDRSSAAATCVMTEAIGDTDDETHEQRLVSTVSVRATR